MDAITKKIIEIEISCAMLKFALADNKDEDGKIAKEYAEIIINELKEK